jgi:oxalate decarboxylase/phosphoglucose isomerase-like protein (cupin superfamily)
MKTPKLPINEEEARMTVFAAQNNARTYNFQAGDVGTVPLCDGPLR